MPNLTRRQAVATLAGVAAAGLLRASGPAGSAAPSGERPPGTSPATDRIRHSVCRWCYKDIPLESLARSAKEIGLESVELLDPPEWEVVRAYGLTCAMANGTTTIPVGFNRLEHHARFVPSMIERIEACGRAGLPNVICFSGNRDGLSDEQGLENCAVGLKRIVGAAEMARVTVCMELLNSKVTHPDYMCDHTAWGVELVKRVGSERFKLLYDIFHLQIMEGDVIRTIQQSHPYIAHYHTGGVPGRHEIDETQELNYPAIVRAIQETGYRGFLGQEFVPVHDPMRSLRDAVRRCTV